MKPVLSVLVVTACLPVLGDAVHATPSGAAARSPVEHTIIVYQENISFDHYFGTYGHGANGIPAGVSLTHTSSGTTYGPYSPFELDGSSQGTTCDVDHGYTDMIQMADHGAMDQYLQFGNDKTAPNPSSSTDCPSFETSPGGAALALGYYAGSKGDPGAPLQNYWDLASRYTLADNFFQGMYGPSTPGAEWLVAATANTVHDPNPDGDVCDADYAPSMPQQDIPNLGEEASSKGISWAWFQGDFGSCSGSATNGYSPHHDPFQYFTSTADLSHSWAWDPNLDYSEPNRHQRDLNVLYDALNGTALNGTVPTLPDVSWVKAPQADDGHPGYSGPAGDDAFVGDLVNRVKGSPYWGHTAIIVTFDETGGWWDHVAPPEQSGHFAPWIGGSPNLSGCQYPGNGQACGEAGFGPREPLLVISPRARKQFVDHQLMDTSSLVQWVEWNYDLPALGVWDNRDSSAGSLRGAFDF